MRGRPPANRPCPKGVPRPHRLVWRRRGSRPEPAPQGATLGATGKGQSTGASGLSPRRPVAGREPAFSGQGGDCFWSEHDGRTTNPTNTMMPDAKKIVAAAKMEGRLVEIQCDTCVLPGNHLVAVLEWGNLPAHGGLRYVHLRPELLRPSKRRHIEFEYQNHHEPIVIPPDLADMPQGLTDRALRRGFFQIA